MNRLILQGSPRSNGRCARLALALEKELRGAYPEDDLRVLALSDLRIAPCEACAACLRRVASGEDVCWESANAGAALLADDAAGADALPADDVAGAEALSAGDAVAIKRQRLAQVGKSCVIADDMPQVFEAFAWADELLLVAPVFFAGPPAQLKALLDRLQPCFWNLVRGLPKCPAFLYVVGEGNDPHGFAPLAGIIRSALAPAGFELAGVFDWVGKISPEGDAPLLGAEEEPSATGSAVLQREADGRRRPLLREAYPWKED